MPISNAAYAAHHESGPMTPYKYTTRDPLEHDVIIEVMFCGICHSDIHTVRGDWTSFPFKTFFPLVPGHEFTGVVAKVGSKVTKHKVGDRVGVGCFVGCCLSCENCKRGLDQYCNEMIGTYGGLAADGTPATGGYGRYVACHEHCAVRVPEAYPMDKAAPLFCAGITTYSPFKHWKMDRGNLTIGVVGLGGLGHCAVMWAASIPSNNVYVFSRNESKKDLALKLGAKGMVISTNEDDMKAHREKFDYIIDTVSAGKNLSPYVQCLTLDGTMICVGAPPDAELPKIPIGPMVVRRRTIAASMIGGIAELQEMINYADAKEIYPMIELISCDKIDQAYERVTKSDVKFRFVLDVKNSAPAL